MQVAKPGTSILSNIAPIQNSLGDNNLVLPKNNKKKMYFQLLLSAFGLWGAKRRYPASNWGSFYAACSLQVLTYHYISFFVSSKADKPEYFYPWCSLYSLDLVVLHTGQA